MFEPGSSRIPIQSYLGKRVQAHHPILTWVMVLILGAAMLILKFLGFADMPKAY